MILTVDRKRKFLITMIIIMACATAINYGLYNVLSTYLKSDTRTTDIYGGVQLNIIIILVIIAVVTVIMIILIPKENVNELMSRIGNSENNGTVLTGTGTSSGSSLGLGDSVGTDYDKELDDMVDEDLDEGLNIGEKK